jgi:hypothetical protein
MAEKSDKYAKLAFVLMASDQMSNVLKTAVENANGQFSKLEIGMAKVGETSLRIGTHMRLLGQQITRSVYNMVKEAADYVDVSDEMAEVAGLQTEEWQKLAYAADFSGVSTEQLQGAMNKFNKYINAAAAGSKSQIQTFEDLGIKIRDASGAMRPTQEIFKDVADVFKDTTKSAAKSSLQMELLGKSGTKLASLLNEGRAGLENFGKEAMMLGLTVNKQEFKNFNDSMDYMKWAVLGAKIKLSSALLPAIKVIISVINNLISSISRWSNEHQKTAKAIMIVVAGAGALLLVLGTAGMVIGATIYSVLQLKRALGFLGKALHLKQAALFIKDLITVRLKTLLQAAASKIAAISQRVHNAAVREANMVPFTIAIIRTRLHQIRLAAAQKVATAAQWLYNRAIDAAKIVAHGAEVVWLGAKKIAVAGATNVATAAQWLYNRAIDAAKIVAHGAKITWLGAKKIAVAGATNVATAAQWLFNKSISAAKVVAHGAKIALLGAKNIAVAGATKVATAAQWLFNAAMNANPIAWVIAAVVALIAIVVVLVRNWDKVGAFFKRLWDGIKKTVSVALKGIINAFLNFTPLGIIIKNFGRIVTWLSNLWQDLRQVFAGGLSGIVSFFVGLPSRFLEYGRNILQGLIDGIISMINRPGELIREAVGNITKSFTEMLGIHSPSSLFMEYGINITRGLTGGMNAGLPDITQSSGQMAAQAVDGFGRSFQVNADRYESVYDQLQRGYESPASESNIIPASQIFDNSTGSNYSGGSPIQYTQNITFSGSMSEQDKQDFSQELRQHATDVIDIMRRYFDNKERLSFS